MLKIDPGYASTLPTIRHIVSVFSVFAVTWHIIITLTVLFRELFDNLFAVTANSVRSKKLQQFIDKSTDQRYRRLEPALADTVDVLLETLYNFSNFSNDFVTLLFT